MIALFVLACVLPVMWLGQTALLLAAGLPIRWRLDVHGTPPAVRTGCRAVTQIALLGAIASYPAFIGRGVWSYYRELLPGGAAPWSAARGALISVLCLALLYLAWNAADCVRFAIRRAPRRIVRRFIMLPFTVALGAAAEELVFRAVLLKGLLEWLPTLPAVLIGATIFAGAHYVREVKRRWTFPGHVALGLLLCLAFVRTGNLWLPMGLHAGGIFAIMAARPFVRYEGPAWITGASIFPFAGVVGILALGSLTSLVWILPP